MKAKDYFYVSLFALSVVWTIVFSSLTRLSNPDMTDTRLFLNFWPIYLFNIALVFGTYYLIYKLDND